MSSYKSGVDEYEPQSWADRKTWEHRCSAQGMARWVTFLDICTECGEERPKEDNTNVCQVEGTHIIKLVKAGYEKHRNHYACTRCGQEFINEF